MAQSTTGILLLNVDEIIFNDNTILKTATDINNNKIALATNTTAIALANTNITANNTDISNRNIAIALANTNITNNTTAIALANTNITNNTTAISTLNEGFAETNVDVGLNTIAIALANTNITSNRTFLISLHSVANANTTAIALANTNITATTNTANTTNTRLNTLFTNNAETRFQFTKGGFWGRIKMTSGHSSITRLYAQPSVNSKTLYLICEGHIECVSLTQTSDDRIKNNEKLIENATETLMKLTPQIYDKYDNMDLSGNYKKNSGLITQEVYYNAPELRHLVTLGLEDDKEIIPDEMDLSKVNIGEDPDYSKHGWSKTETSSLNYIGLIAYLIKSNQELNKRLLDLETQK